MDIMESILLALCTGGSGCLFYGIGVWISRKKDPVSFWAGSKISREAVSNVSAFNKDHGALWKLYSVLYFLCVPFAVAGLWLDWGHYMVLGILVFACTIGIYWLIWRYKSIERTYIPR